MPPIVSRGYFVISSANGTPRGGACLGSALAKAGVSVSFSRTHRPSVTSTTGATKGTRQPQSQMNCSRVSANPRIRNSPLAAMNPTGAPSCGNRPETGAHMRRRVLDRQQGRTAPFAAQAETLAETQDAEQHRR